MPVSTVSKHLKALGLRRIWRLEEELAPPAALRARRAGIALPRRRQALRQDRSHRAWDPRQPEQEEPRCRLGGGLRLRGRPHAPGLRGGPSGREREVRHGLLRRALRWFDSLGIRCRRVLTDNAKCYAEFKAFQALCDEHGVRQGFTRPYTPRTNGKAERFIQTLKRRWAYRHAYRTSAIRAASLRPWVTHYNHRRPHRALGKRTPMDRLREARQQAA